MEFTIAVGDEVVVYGIGRDYKRATVVEIWPSQYPVLEIEYDNIFTLGKTRKIVSGSDIRGVKPHVKEG